MEMTTSDIGIFKTNVIINYRVNGRTEGTTTTQFRQTDSEQSTRSFVRYQKIINTREL